MMENAESIFLGERDRYDLVTPFARNRSSNGSELKFLDDELNRDCGLEAR